MSADPHLIAVTLHPFVVILVQAHLLQVLETCSRRSRRHLVTRHLLQPLSRNNLLAVPFALLQEQLSHLGHILGFQIQSPTAATDTLGRLVPLRTLDVQRLEQARVEVVEHLLAGHLLHYGRKHIRANGVIQIIFARLVHYGPCQEGRHPVKGILPQFLGFLIMSTSHRKQVAHGHGLQVVAGLGRQFVGEELDHRVVELQFAFVDGKSYSRSRERLAHRMHCVRHLGSLSVEPFLQHNLTMFQDHYAVQRD